MQPAIVRQLVTLTVAGKTAEVIAETLGCSVRTVERYRADPDVRRQIAEKEATGLSPRDALQSLLYHPNPEIRRKSAVDLSRLNEREPESKPVERVLPEGARTLIIHPAGQR